MTGSMASSTGTASGEAESTSKPEIQRQPPPPPSVDEATLKSRAAAARSYALSSASTGKKKLSDGTSSNAAAAAAAPPPHYGYNPPPYPHMPYHPYPHPHFYPPPPPHAHPHHQPPSSPQQSTAPAAATAPAATGGHYPPYPPPYYYYPPGYHYPANHHHPHPHPPATTNPPSSPPKQSHAQGSQKETITVDTDNNNNKKNDDDDDEDDNDMNPAELTPPKPKKTHLTKPSPLSEIMAGEPFSSSNWDDDYAQFVKSLGDFEFNFEDEDGDEEEEDFQLFNMEDEDEEEDDDEEDNDEDDEDDNGQKQGSHGKRVRNDSEGSDTSNEHRHQQGSSSPLNFLSEPEYGDLRELEEELGGLEEEDLEAAVATLLGNPSSSNKPTANPPFLPAAQLGASGQEFQYGSMAHHHHPKAKQLVSQEMVVSPTTHYGSRSGRVLVTAKQVKRLRRVLKRHYQLLIQQAVLAIQATKLQKTTQGIKENTDFLCGENADDLVVILDGAVGMLQNLEQNWKDAIRNSIQMEVARKPSQEQNAAMGYRNVGQKYEPYTMPPAVYQEQRRLTRTAFTKTLQQNNNSNNDQPRTMFAIKGLNRLQGTFKDLDQSVGMEEPSYFDACRLILEQAGADCDSDMIPGKRDLSDVFCDAHEFLGDDFEKPCDLEQKMYLRRSRHLFTAGEDNLVMRGVNLYGEKQWVLIADRYLPDRSVNAISQRYSKVCVMLYKANGVHIDRDGNLIEPPKLESVDDLDEEKVSQLKPVDPPAILNVHRWSLEEDLTLLKAVPLMGHMWAELGARLIPHRDRGHLRKRYQVLERRVKATVSRSQKDEEIIAKISPKKLQQQSPTSPQQLPRRRLDLEQELEQEQAPVPFRKKEKEQPSLSKEESAPPVHPNALDSHHDTEASRFEFEKLVKDNDTEWSQMSRLNKIMEDEVESEIVGALASGLSNSSAQEPASSTNTPTKRRPAIMETVLENASSTATRQSSARSLASQQLSPKPKDAPPSKRTIYSTNGTPISLSNAFQYTNSRYAPTPPSVQNRMQNAMMEENDLEAISALNSLSNSPARSIFARPESEKKRKAGMKSLFAAAVGGVHENDKKTGAKKRKLDFNEKK